MVSRIALTALAVNVVLLALPIGAHSRPTARGAALIARGCPDAGILPASDLSRRQAARVVVCLINVERAKRRAPQVVTSSLLRRAASYQSADMVRRSYFGHISPTGETLRMRVRRTGYMRGRRVFVLGETSAWGSGLLASPSSLVADLMSSQTHRRIMLSRRYREVGAGMSFGSPSGGVAEADAVTLAVNFGRRVK